MKKPNSTFLRRFVLSLAFGTLASCALHAQMVLLSDTFTGATTTPNPAVLYVGGQPGTNSLNITSTAGYTYSLYGGGNVATTVTLGISGGDLTWGATQGTGFSAAGVGGPTFATNFTAGSVTAAEIESLTFSFNYAFNNATGTNFEVNTASGTGSYSSYVTVLASTAVSGTESFSFNAATSQLFANAMNTLGKSTLSLQLFGNGAASFGNNSSPSSVTLSNLLVTTSVPEPSTYALLLGGAALLFGFRRLRRTTI